MTVISFVRSSLHQQARTYIYRSTPEGSYRVQFPGFPKLVYCRGILEDRCSVFNRTAAVRVATTHSLGWCLGERAVPYRVVPASTPTFPTLKPGWMTRLSLNWVKRNDKVYCLINLLENNNNRQVTICAETAAVSCGTSHVSA